MVGGIGGMRLVIDFEEDIGVTLVDSGDLLPEGDTVAVRQFEAGAAACAVAILPASIGPLQIKDDVEFHSGQGIDYLLDQALIGCRSTGLGAVAGQPESFG